MDTQLPLYKLQIDKDAEGMDYIALVDYPAHGKSWVAFQKQTPVQKVEFKQHFNEDKRIVTGVAIATNLQIYRRREDGTEYNVFFTPQDTKIICQELFKNDYMHNVNEMHDMNKDVKGMYLFESFFINDKRTNIPEAFANQNLQKGSWITSYKVDSDEAWEKIKNGEFAGFSIEGWFKEVEVNLSKKKLKSKNNKMKKKSLLERLGFKQPEKKTVKFNKDKHAEATTVDGLVIMWEGDAPVVGGELFVKDEESEDFILAAAGDYSYELDGTTWVVTVDESGVITDMKEAEEMEEEEEEEEFKAMEAMKKDYESKFASHKKDSDAKMVTMATEVDSLTKLVGELKEKLEEVADPDYKRKQKHSGGSNKPGWKKTK